MNIPFDKSPITLRRISGRAIRLVAVHAALFALAYFIAFYIRNDFSISKSWLDVYLATVVGVVLVKVAVFYGIGLCHNSWARVAFGDLTTLLWASTLAMLVLATIDTFAVSTGLFGITRVRRSVILLDWVATIILVGGIRTLWRSGGRRDRREDDER